MKWLNRHIDMPVGCVALDGHLRSKKLTTYVITCLYRLVLSKLNYISLQILKNPQF